MLDLINWFRRLLWRDDSAPSEPTESLSVVLWVGVGRPRVASPGRSADAWLFASSAREAAAMLGELARLGTVARVTLRGLAELSPADARELMRAARRLRCRGLWVEACPREPSAGPSD